MGTESRQVTRELADFVRNPPGTVVSPRATDVVKQAVLDLFGVTVAGTVEEASLIALAYARSQGAPGASAVLGGRARLAPSAAALVNGTSGHALDFDDIGLGAGHISVAIIPAVLAVAELVGADGLGFIEALVIGYEVAHRLTTMYVDTRLGPYAAGYHKPSVYSVFGATSGAARLLGLTTDQTAHALGIAASQAGGLRANFGTMTKPLHAGLAGRTGVEAALLAQAGFTASTEILEQRFGWHDVICRGEGELATVVAGLGDRYAVEEGMVFKQYPCCGANHYAIDATIALLRESGLHEPDVARIDVWIEQRNLNEVLVYPWPRTALEGKFSLAYNVAAALADRAVSVQTFTGPALQRLSPFRDKVFVHATDDLPQNGARVTIMTTDGRTFEREQLIVRGSLAQPMAWHELESKFRANVQGRINPGAVDDAIAAIAGLDKVNRLADVTEPLLG
ncbi:2-methylcitrate dehydratase PrpD [Mycobacterium sp. MAA66]|uniref:MmgE/PrpD family protein n=1 Tax=Mycobacterium sp. MAA66 TaxID=3156297 RepID=UPI003518D795